MYIKKLFPTLNLFAVNSINCDFQGEKYKVHYLDESLIIEGLHPVNFLMAAAVHNKFPIDWTNEVDIRSSSNILIINPK